MKRINLTALIGCVVPFYMAITNPVLAYDIESVSQDNAIYVLLVNDNPNAVFHSISITNSNSLPNFVSSVTASIVPETVLGGGSDLAVINFDTTLGLVGSTGDIELTVNGLAAGSAISFDISVPLELVANAAAAQGQLGSTVPAPDPDGVDSDGDGVTDALEVAFGSDPQVAGSTPSSPNDADFDGIADSADNCPSVSNADQADTDSDGTGNACDSTPNGDDDLDGFDNNTDNCPAIANADQTDTDADGAGDVCDSTPNGDDDLDGIDNNADNCPADANADQLDSDSDNIGDVCDASPFGDEVSEEFVPMVPAFAFGLLAMLLAIVGLPSIRKRANK